MLPFKYYADIFDGDYFTQLENEIDFNQEMFNPSAWSFSFACTNRLR